MARRLVFAPDAEAQLLGLYRHIAGQGSPDAATRFTDAIVDRCEQLADMPLVGTSRGDIRPGLRTIAFRRRVVIAYAVLKLQVTILGVFYGGQDYESLLREED